MRPGPKSIATQIGTSLMKNVEPSIWKSSNGGVAILTLGPLYRTPAASAEV